MPGKIVQGQASIFIKKHTGQLIIRKAGVDRTPEGQAKVTARNVAFSAKTKGNKVSSGCARPNLPVGQRYKAHKACLRIEGHKLFHGGA
jgi:hypothetical protein